MHFSICLFDFMDKEGSCNGGKGMKPVRSIKEARHKSWRKKVMTKNGIRKGCKK